MSNGLLIKLIASRSESFVEMAEFVETHQGGKALHFEGYAYSMIRDFFGDTSTTRVEVVLEELLQRVHLWS